jgi:hypothetical protein
MSLETYTVNCPECEGQGWRGDTQCEGCGGCGKMTMAEPKSKRPRVLAWLLLIAVTAVAFYFAVRK